MANTDPLPSKPTALGEFAERFLASVENGRLEEKTKKSYRNGWRLLKATPVSHTRVDQITAFVGLLMIVAFAMLWALHTPPTVLVLPLDNFTGDARLDRLADARTDYLIASLGADPADLRVIDRPTAYKFKNTGECIIHIGKQLHADYVLVGSIDPAGDGPRLSGGVFRVADNTQVWSRADIDPLNDDDVRELPKAISAALR